MHYPKVTYVSNITDIDDKIIDAANDLNVPINEITQKYTDIYNEDMSKLLVKTPDINPKQLNTFQK
jgi:cysteinyl-tRNA synthetase